MAKKFSRETEFDEKGEYIAKKKLIIGGRKFVSGDPFDWKKVTNGDVRRSRLLLEAGHIWHKADYEKNGDKPEVVEAKEGSSKIEVVEDETGTVETQETSESTETPETEETAETEVQDTTADSGKKKKGKKK